uniref:Cytochrome c oxidase subunit 1 n=1 Tax=Picea glauca TaxID=3330 RepID=A0A101LWP7_PICGL|nr:cytochrome c oxidase subunit 1 [Picea glauca]QHR87943.1 hypothetical protein Q903MT_gene1955 [Picea sitchensis]
MPCFICRMGGLYYEPLQGKIHGSLRGEFDLLSHALIGAFGYATLHSLLSRCLRWMECCSFGYVSVFGIHISEWSSPSRRWKQQQMCSKSPVLQNPTTPEWYKVL